MTHRGGIAAAVAGIAIVAAAVLLRTPAASSPPPAKVGTRQIDPQTWIVSRADKEKYLGDLDGVTRHITLTPDSTTEKDAIMELSISALAEESPMYRAGFRKDDRILKVNGTPIGTLTRAFNLIHEIRASPRLTVQVQRGGRILDYRIDFE
jgi:general secretion pathway protein C